MYTDQAARLRELAEQYQQDVAVSPPISSARAKFFAVTSGKGGVGKTSLAVNLAIALAKKGKRVTLIDLDLGLANIDIMLDLDAAYTLEHVISGYKNIEDVSVDGPEAVTIIPGGSGLTRLADLDDNQREHFIKNLSRLTLINDYIIFDTAVGIAENVIRFALAADEIIVVTTQEPTAITDAYALIKVVARKNPAVRINIVLNMVRTRQEAHSTFLRLQSVVRQFVGVELCNLGFIVEDACVGTAVMRRKPLLTLFPFSSAAKSIKDVTHALLEKNSGGQVIYNNFVHTLTALFRREREA